MLTRMLQSLQYTRSKQPFLTGPTTNQRTYLCSFDAMDRYHSASVSGSALFSSLAAIRDLNSDCVMILVGTSNHVLGLIIHPNIIHPQLVGTHKWLCTGFDRPGFARLTDFLCRRCVLPCGTAKMQKPLG